MHRTLKVTSLIYDLCKHSQTTEISISLHSDILGVMRPADARAFSLPNSRKGPGIEVGVRFILDIVIHPVCKVSFKDLIQNWVFAKKNWDENIDAMLVRPLYQSLYARPLLRGLCACLMSGTSCNPRVANLCF